MTDVRVEALRGMVTVWRDVFHGVHKHPGAIDTCPTGMCPLYSEALHLLLSEPVPPPEDEDWEAERIQEERDAEYGLPLTIGGGPVPPEPES